MDDASKGPQFLAPMLIASNFQSTLTFYRSALGLDVKGAAPYAECRTSTSLLTILDGKFMTQTRELELPIQGSLGSTGHTLIAIEVDDLEERFQRLMVAGIKFLSPPSDQLPLGRKYAFLRDPDGRTVVLLGPRPPASVA